MWETQIPGANINKKRLIVVLAVLAIVMAAVAWWRFRATTGEMSASSGQEQTGLSEAPKSQTREAVPANTVVPEAGSVNVPENVAAPRAVSPVRAGVAANNRVFEIKAEGDKFSPDTIIAKVGDEIKINITAVDKDYAFTQPDYGFNVVILKGQTKLIPFMGSAIGKFTFYCASCGGPEKGPVGYVIVMPKD